jgi:hypothetical protein
VGLAGVEEREEEEEEKEEGESEEGKDWLGVTVSGPTSRASLEA